MNIFSGWLIENRFLALNEAVLGIFLFGLSYLYGFFSTSFELLAYSMGVVVGENSSNREGNDLPCHSLRAPS
jgi:hypothetical protein